MRDMVASIIDYDPDVQSYRDEINRYINEIYRNWFCSRPYEFSQKTVDVFCMPDCSIPDTSTIQGSNSTIRNNIEANATLSKTDSEGVGFVQRFKHTHNGIVTGKQKTSTVF